MLVDPVQIMGSFAMRGCVGEEVCGRVDGVISAASSLHRNAFAAVKKRFRELDLLLAKMTVRRSLRHFQKSLDVVSAIEWYQDLTAPLCMS